MRSLGDISSFADALESARLISHYFGAVPTVKEIHFIVERPDQSKDIILHGSTHSDYGRTFSIRQAEARPWCVSCLSPLIASHTVVVDKTYDLIEIWSTPTNTLPEDAFQLVSYLSKGLTEDEKIPLAHHEFSLLLSQTMDAKNMCSEADLKKLFRPGEDENANYLWKTFLLPTIYRVPPETNGTESSFISFWDRNIRDVLSVIITEWHTQCIRDSNHDTSTLLQRPDFALLTGGVCIFRGEEKPPVFSGTHPREELTEKFVWIYDPAPYILGWPISLISLAFSFIRVQVTSLWEPTCRSLRFHPYRI